MLKKNNVKAVYTYVEDVMIDGAPALNVRKAREKYGENDANTYAKYPCDFHNGTIEVQVKSRLLDDAPAHARGFIGIAYRISENDDAFECLYIRPTNGRTDDPVRKVHALQYFSYPTYTFAYFRDHGITKYEGPCDIGLDEWIDLKAEIHDDKATLYVNGEAVLHVDDMIHGNDMRGALGMFVDIGTDGYFRNLVITPED